LQERLDGALENGHARKRLELLGLRAAEARAAAPAAMIAETRDRTNAILSDEARVSRQPVNCCIRSDVVSMTRASRRCRPRAAQTTSSARVVAVVTSG
jgi:hypothetical protein